MFIVSGFPSVGKSTLLSNLAGVYSEVAAYEFTTLTTVPGVIRYKGAKIQVSRGFMFAIGQVFLVTCTGCSYQSYDVDRFGFGEEVFENYKGVQLQVSWGLTFSHCSRFSHHSNICSGLGLVQSFWWTKKPKFRTVEVSHSHSSGAAWESRWPSWAVRPNEPSGFRGRKAILNHASALVTTCP